MLWLAVEYFILVFFASLGVIQFALVRSGIKGLWFFSSPLKGYAFGVLLPFLSFAWFFLSEDRNQPGLEGLQQTLLFAFSSLLALFITIIFSSIKNRKEFGLQKDGEGIEALKGMTYFQALFKQKDDRSR